MNQNINLKDYENPNEEVLNDNSVADTSNIENQVDNLKKRLDEMSPNKDVEKLKEEFKNFFERFPTIFNKVIEGTMEMGRLKFMLRMINEIEKKKNIKTRSFYCSW